VNHSSFTFWNSFPWELNSFPELQNIKVPAKLFASESKSLFSCPNTTFRRIISRFKKN
jgi:hypothetical protein